MDQPLPSQRPFNRNDAYQILIQYVKTPNLIKHCLACEAVMKALYQRLYQNTPQNPQTEELWGITGLLHDADYELSKGHPEKHGLLLFEKLQNEDSPFKNKIPEEVVYAIKAHNYEKTFVLPKSLLDWSIACCDQLTGIIVAATLIHPDKKLSSITTEFVLNRMNEKSFARGADRSSIEKCEEKLNIPLTEFVAISLKAMQGINNDLGL